MVFRECRECHSVFDDRNISNIRTSMSLCIPCYVEMRPERMHHYRPGDNRREIEVLTQRVDGLEMQVQQLRRLVRQQQRNQGRDQVRLFTEDHAPRPEFAATANRQRRNLAQEGELVSLAPDTSDDDAGAVQGGAATEEGEANIAAADRRRFVEELRERIQRRQIEAINNAVAATVNSISPPAVQREQARLRGMRIQTEFLRRNFRAHQQRRATGLTRDEIARLRMTSITEAQMNNLDECTVCLGFFRLAERVVHLDCNHYFHLDCITPWLGDNNNCPICRAVIGGDTR